MNMRIGWIYCMQCTSYRSNLFKIGICQRETADERLKDAQKYEGTFNPGKFNIIREEKLNDCVFAERQIHKFLQDKKWSDNTAKEWFETDYSEIDKLFKFVKEYDMKITDEDDIDIDDDSKIKLEMKEIFFDNEMIISEYKNDKRVAIFSKNMNSIMYNNKAYKSPNEFQISHLKEYNESINEQHINVRGNSKNIKLPQTNESLYDRKERYKQV